MLTFCGRSGAKCRTGTVGPVEMHGPDRFRPDRGPDRLGLTVNITIPVPKEDARTLNQTFPAQALLFLITVGWPSAAN